MVRYVQARKKSESSFLSHHVETVRSGHGRSDVVDLVSAHDREEGNGSAVVAFARKAWTGGGNGSAVVAFAGEAWTLFIGRVTEKNLPTSKKRTTPSWRTQSRRSQRGYY